jgi:hypothetical protein
LQNNGHTLIHGIMTVLFGVVMHSSASETAALISLGQPTIIAMTLHLCWKITPPSELQIQVSNVLPEISTYPINCITFSIQSQFLRLHAKRQTISYQSEWVCDKPCLPLSAGESPLCDHCSGETLCCCQERLQNSFTAMKSLHS